MPPRSCEFVAGDDPVTSSPSSAAANMVLRGISMEVPPVLPGCYYDLIAAVKRSLVPRGTLARANIWFTLYAGSCIRRRMKICHYNNNQAGVIVEDNVYPIGNALINTG